MNYVFNQEKNTAFQSQWGQLPLEWDVLVLGTQTFFKLTGVRPPLPNTECSDVQYQR